MNYFDKKNTLYEISDKYPETIPVFTSNGFEHMGDPEKREKFGKSISLDTALLLKQIDYDTFAKVLSEAIKTAASGEDLTLQKKKSPSGTGLKVVGLLPCPVRLPLLEAFSPLARGLNMDYELKAASMGLEWVEENLKGIIEVHELPDLFVSAGFDIFFDEQKIGKFKNEGIFKDTTGIDSFNSTFQNIELKDPKGHYSMIGVVPAVFLINTKELGGIPVPQSWDDILDPVFEQRISLPVGDFDLFNGILLNIHKLYGDEGVRKLGRNLLESLHPSQMVKSDKKEKKRPIVTIMPYFFTKMVKGGGPMAAVWPKDGAIISPIFMLAKKEKAKQLQPVVDFFISEEAGRILSHQGLFPSVNPKIDNQIDKENQFMWLGWDYIYNNDIAGLITHCTALFEEQL